MQHFEPLVRPITPRAPLPAATGPQRQSGTAVAHRARSGQAGGSPAGNGGVRPPGPAGAMGTQRGQTAARIVSLQRSLGNRYVQRLMAASPDRLATQADPARLAPRVAVAYITIYLGTDEYIDFHTDRGVYRYDLQEEDLKPGEYKAQVTPKGNNLQITLETSSAGSGRFTYSIKPGQPNPSTFFAGPATVVVTITRDKPPAGAGGEEPDTRDPSVKYLTIEEALRRCEANDLPGVKIFPYRGTRFGGAPLTAHRDGNDVIVKMPVYVLGNSDFQAQTRTLPTETFTGGVRLRANEIVRVHTYEPRWYHLNITGSTSGDLEQEFCVTGEGMLKLAEQSTNRTLLNIGLTVLDAATLFVPVGRLASMIGRPVVQVASRGARNLAIGVMLGLREAAPTAFAGIASRSSIVLVEQQAAGQVAGRAISETVGHVTIQFSQSAATRAVVGEAVAQAGTRATAQAGASVPAEAISRTVTVTVVDAAGHQAVSTLTTPTGDKALDAIIDEAWGKTFTEAGGEAAAQAGQAGVTKVAPEVAAGFTPSQVQAFDRLLSKPLSSPEIKIMQELWDDAARKADQALLTKANSRYLFDLHRNRFWARVRANPAARAIFEQAGCKFSGGAPYYVLNGRRITITIDHIIERQTSPQLALTASNLRFAFSRENSVVLRLLHELDPFQKH